MIIRNLIVNLQQTGRQDVHGTNRQVIKVPGRRDPVEELTDGSRAGATVHLVGFRGTGKSLAMAKAIDKINDYWSQDPNDSPCQLAVYISLPVLQQNMFVGIIQRWGGRFLMGKTPWVALNRNVAAFLRQLEDSSETHEDRKETLKSVRGALPDANQIFRKQTQEQFVSANGGWRETLFRMLYQVLGSMEAMNQAANDYADAFIEAFIEPMQGGTVYLFLDDYSECTDLIQDWVKDVIALLTATAQQRGLDLQSNNIFY